MSFVTAVIVTNHAEVHYARKNIPHGLLLLCTNIETYEYCHHEQFPARLLNEDLHYGQHQQINLWGFESTFQLLTLLNPQGKTAVFLESIFTDLKAVFVQILKFSLTFEAMISAYNLRNWIAFREEKSIFLWTLGAYLKRFHPSISFQLWEPLPLAEVEPKKNVKNWLLDRAAGFNNLIAEWIFRSNRQGYPIVGLASGGLRHLGSLAAKLHKKNNHQLIFCESQFNFEKFKFALKHGMAFFVLSKPKTIFTPDLPYPLTFPQNSFRFRDRDLTGLCAEILTYIFQQNLYSFSYSFEELTELFHRCGVNYCLLDEDASIRRLFAATAEYLGKQSFVVSHGVPSVPIPFEPEKRTQPRYRSSITFLHSEFEGEIHRNLFFDPQRMIQTGMPRYDRIVKMTGSRASLRKGALLTSKNILLCIPELKDYDFRSIITIIGLNNFYGYYMKTIMKDLFGILSDRNDVQVTIKPHYNDERAWRRYLATLNPQPRRMKIVKHHADIFALLQKTDLVITPESSVICESLMFRKPVIVLNYSPEPLNAPYERHGLFFHARNANDLKVMIHLALDDLGYQEKLRKNCEKHFAYYAGKFDGRNAERAAEYLVRSVNLKQTLVKREAER